MGFTKTVLRFAAPVPQIENFERYLFIGPHPDDIEIGAGATAAKLAAMGKKVCFLICTDGRYGDNYLKEKPTWEQLVEIRRKEAKASATALGVDDVRFLDLSDGGFYDIGEMKDGIAGVIGSFKPDVVFAPDPCVSSECHADHLNTGLAAREIVNFAPYDGIMKKHGAAAAPVKAVAFYMTAKPNRYVGTTGFFEKQIASIRRCHVSQFPPELGNFDSIELYLKLRAFEFGLRSFHRKAEGFRVLGDLHMHCLPEAGN